jgi:hypothetical protein
MFEQVLSFALVGGASAFGAAIAVLAYFGKQNAELRAEVTDLRIQVRTLTAFVHYTAGDARDPNGYSAAPAAG